MRTTPKTLHYFQKIDFEDIKKIFQQIVYLSPKEY